MKILGLKEVIDETTAVLTQLITYTSTQLLLLHRHTIVLAFSIFPNCCPFQHLFYFYQDLNTEDPSLQDLRHRNIHRFQSTSQIPSIIQTYFPTYISNETRLEDNSYSHPSEYPPPRCSKLSTYALPKILHHPS